MFDEAVDTYPFVFDSAPDQYKTQEMCDKVVSTQEMCDKTVNACLSALKFVSDSFFTTKSLQIVILPYSLTMICTLMI